MIEVSFDPGLHVCGVSIWKDGTLVYASPVRRYGPGSVERSEAWSLMGETLSCKLRALLFEYTGQGWPHRMVYEQMVLYPGEGGQKKFLALSALEAVSALAIHELRPRRVKPVTAKEWTKGKDKVANHPLILSSLRPDEQLSVPLAGASIDSIAKGDVRSEKALKNIEGDAEHCIDAIGIYLFDKGRLRG